jgi:hypothetical protein
MAHPVLRDYTPQFAAKLASADRLLGLTLKIRKTLSQKLETESAKFDAQDISQLATREAWFQKIIDRVVVSISDWPREIAAIKGQDPSIIFLKLLTYNPGLLHEHFRDALDYLSGRPIDGYRSSEDSVRKERENAERQVNLLKETGVNFTHEFLQKFYRHNYIKMRGSRVICTAIAFRIIYKHTNKFRNMHLDLLKPLNRPPASIRRNTKTDAPSSEMDLIQLFDQAGLSLTAVKRAIRNPAIAKALHKLLNAKP